MPPNTHNTDLHFHSAREEAWFVRSGSGIARPNEDAHPLRPGSFWLCQENGGVGHRIEGGPDGMQLVTMGDLIPEDVRVYPEKRTFRAARGSNSLTDGAGACIPLSGDVWRECAPIALCLRRVPTSDGGAVRRSQGGHLANQVLL
jgi:hypothetical protein